MVSIRKKKSRCEWITEKEDAEAYFQAKLKKKKLALK